MIVKSFTIHGIKAVPVTIEVTVSNRLPSTVIVGLPEAAAKETVERMRTVMHALGYSWFRSRVTIEVSPTNLRHDPRPLDVPIALALLGAMGALPTMDLQDKVFVGELTHGGTLSPVRGVLSMALALPQNTQLIVPLLNAPEALPVTPRVVGVHNLKDLLADLQRGTLLQLDPPKDMSVTPLAGLLDMCEVAGNHQAKRALEIAAVMGLRVLMVGAPGCGKTMLASRVPSILPKMTSEESIEATFIHSMAGLRPFGSGLLDARPFRAPHHSISAGGILGDSRMRPGEASLAHAGVLFLDDVPEFTRNVMEYVQHAWRLKHVNFSRTGGEATFPSNFMLVGAMNPCHCGFKGHPRQLCMCNDGDVSRYLRRAMRPNAWDIKVDLGCKGYRLPDDPSNPPAEGSEVIRERVTQARARIAAGPQRVSLEALAYIASDAVNARYPTDDDVIRLVHVSRSIAVLAGSEVVLREHVEEAFTFTVSSLDSEVRV